MKRLIIIIAILLPLTSSGIENVYGGFQDKYKNDELLKDRCANFISIESFCNNCKSDPEQAVAEFEGYYQTLPVLEDTRSEARRVLSGLIASALSGTLKNKSPTKKEMLDLTVKYLVSDEYELTEDVIKMMAKRKPELLGNVWVDFIEEYDVDYRVLPEKWHGAGRLIVCLMRVKDALDTLEIHYRVSGESRMCSGPCGMSVP